MFPPHTYLFTAALVTAITSYTKYLNLQNINDRGMKRLEMHTHETHSMFGPTT